MLTFLWFRRENYNQDNAMVADVLWPLLLTWFNFNPSMDK